MSAELSPNIAAWRNRGELLRLEGSNCEQCKIPHMPQRIICPDCGHDNNTPIEDTTNTSDVVEGQSGQTDIET